MYGMRHAGYSQVWPCSSVHLLLLLLRRKAWARTRAYIQASISPCRLSHWRIGGDLLCCWGRCATTIGSAAVCVQSVALYSLAQLKPGFACESATERSEPHWGLYGYPVYASHPVLHAHLQFGRGTCRLSRPVRHPVGGRESPAPP